MADWQAVFAPILACEFGKFCLDSRKIGAEDGFVLLKSVSGDENAAIARAQNFAKSVNDKAAFIITDVPADELDVAIPVVSHPQIRKVLGSLIAAQLQLVKPAPLPKVVAVTGTNGKTTVSQLVAQLAERSGVSAAIMGTAGNGKLGALEQSANTTGDVLMVHEFLHRMACEGVELVALEASSHGLHQDRLQGVPVEVAIYTNLSHDHLDYHADMDDYRLAKARLFDKAYFPTLAHGVLNADAKYPLLTNDALPSDYKIVHYSQQKPAEYHATAITPSLDGVQIALDTPFGAMTLGSPLLGLFNVDNLLAAVAAFLVLYPQKASELPDLVAQLQGARGRMQRVPSSEGLFLVDYAHTPDALEQVLTSLQRHCTGKLIAVFGCGGDRDKTKRPIMTRAGLDHADHVILTADNPRSEEPAAILSDMQQGLTCEDHYRISIEPDRKTAIAEAVRMAGKDDIVVIAGKGHETYQEIKGVRHDFDDVAVLGDVLAVAKKA
ncbi:UDP-N-acetylmuramoyl-L-alanyl-D-glutamate--2,6-diaminopimelate ligase [Moraxella caviae]|uniref:UDP-N-acetylmuramoyl-L-alanyl-D-glutamate--2,6-diaminopimelate ligase n=1 Tax=Moraxella caviae TaxID=34060 RepID=A0A1T0A269_9GAMM|nr:UDP-N-acetylmuramoyl-L-alanyl-D-glutamate--2,6-diaminopimelate ligase [Moraxella caviae]